MRQRKAGDRGGRGLEPSSEDVGFLGEAEAGAGAAGPAPGLGGLPGGAPTVGGSPGAGEYGKAASLASPGSLPGFELPRGGLAALKAAGLPAPAPLPHAGAAAVSIGALGADCDDGEDEGGLGQPLGASEGPRGGAVASSSGGMGAGGLTSSGLLPHPGLKEAKEPPWWAFLVTYRNIQLSITTLIYFITCIVIHTYCTRWSWYRGVVKFNMVGTPPLHDLLHEILPNTQSMRVLPEIGHVLPVLYLAGSMLYHMDQRSLDCFRTFLWCHGTLLLMRCVSFMSTTLPDASQQCHVSLFVGSCHDLIFSGHVMIMMLATLFVQHFFYVPPVIRLFIGLDAGIVSLLVVSSRNHYTVDVVLAVIAAMFGYVAFTRHPVLVSLGVADPSKVLAKPCFGDVRRKGGFCGCTRAAWGDATGAVGSDGYALLPPSPSPRPSPKLRGVAGGGRSGAAGGAWGGEPAPPAGYYRGGGAAPGGRYAPEGSSSNVAGGDASGLRHRRRPSGGAAHVEGSGGFAAPPSTPVPTSGTGGAASSAATRGGLPRISAPGGSGSSSGGGGARSSSASSGAGGNSGPASPRRPTRGASSGSGFDDVSATASHAAALAQQQQQQALLAAVARDVSAATAPGGYGAPRSRPASMGAPGSGAGLPSDALLALVQQLLLQQPELAHGLVGAAPLQQAGAPGGPRSSVSSLRAAAAAHHGGAPVPLPGLAERSRSCDSPDFDAALGGASGEGGGAGASSGSNSSSGEGAGAGAETAAPHMPAFSPLAGAGAAAAARGFGGGAARPRQGSGDGATTVDTEATDPSVGSGGGSVPASPLQRPGLGGVMPAHTPLWQGSDPQAGAASLALAAALADQLRALVGGGLAGAPLPRGSGGAPRARDRSASESSAYAGGGLPGMPGVSAARGTPASQQRRFAGAGYGVFGSPSMPAYPYTGYGASPYGPVPHPHYGSGAYDDASELLDMSGGGGGEEEAELDDVHGDGDEDPVLLQRLHVRARGLLAKWGADAAAFKAWVANVRAGGVTTSSGMSLSRADSGSEAARGGDGSDDGSAGGDGEDEEEGGVPVAASAARRP